MHQGRSLHQSRVRRHQQSTFQLHTRSLVQWTPAGFRYQLFARRHRKTNFRTKDIDCTDNTAALHAEVNITQRSLWYTKVQSCCVIGLLFFTHLHAFALFCLPFFSGNTDFCLIHITAPGSCFIYAWRLHSGALFTFRHWVAICRGH